MHKGEELKSAAIGHAGQAFRHRVPCTREESLGLSLPAMRAGMPTERSALTRNMLSPVQEAYPAAITCIRQVAQWVRPPCPSVPFVAGTVSSKDNALVCWSCSVVRLHKWQHCTPGMGT